MAYATASQVVSRLGTSGANLLADRDGSGTLSTAELAVITTETEEQSRYIDAHLATHFTLPLTGTNLTNETLTDWCIWLVVESLSLRKGRNVAAWKDKADLVRINLEKVRTGNLRVPGMTYPGDGFTEERRAQSRPVVVNPKGVIRWRR